jgi:hypothetical protein
MESYAECWIGSFYVGATKNDIDPGLISLVRASDKHIVTTNGRELPYVLRRWIRDVDEDEPVDAVFYRTPARVIRDRLELQGYTLEAAQDAFVVSLKARVRYLAEAVEGEHGSFFKGEHELLASTSIDDWMSALRHIKDNDLKHNFHGPTNEWDGGLHGYMLNHEWYGYEGPDLKVGLRLAIEICSDDDEFVYDVTDLVLAGDFEANADLVEYALALSASAYANSGKTIILTEGRTDSRILENALRLLYPHLADYYSFMDFEASRVQGGAGHLVNLVKAFSGSGIVNRVVALFDNDTAAAAALRGLRGVTVPQNLRVMTLPSLDSLTRYPTLGPSGDALLDVNGIAGCLELYLGDDILRDDHGQLAPVQWTGFDPAIRKYQGEVTNKDALHARFGDRVARCIADCTVLSRTDWSGLDVILQEIFRAFREADGRDFRELHVQYHQRD